MPHALPQSNALLGRRAMKTPFYRTSDGQSGIFFTAFGAFVAWQAAQYPLGRAAQMGPGYFPLIIGAMLVVVGLIVMGKSIPADASKSDPLDWRAAALVTIAILASALLLLTAGLLVAIPVLVIVSSLAAREIHWRTTILTAVFLTVMAWLVFIVGLGLRIPLIWS